jgi:ribose transport system substrate-binding protein
MTKSSVNRKRSGAGTLEKGLSVLEAIDRAAHPLSIQEIAAATGIQRLAVYRLVSTLEVRGYVRRADDKRYRATGRRRRLLLGYAAPLTGNTFREDLSGSIQRAAAAAGIDVMVLDNPEDDSAEVMRSAQTLIDARVDVAVFFQPVESLGHMLADRFFSAGLRFITVERPIQGGVYFGANNYQAGKLAGLALGAHARDRWAGRFDRVVLIEGAHTSTNVQARLAGVLVGLREIAGDVPESQVHHLHGNANREASRVAMAELLSRLKRRTRLLVSGFNDISAIGALDAVRQARRERDVVIVGHNAMQEGRAQIRKPNSPFIASVAYFPERYGDKLVRLACAIANGEHVSPAAYTDHIVIDRNNIDRLYPTSAPSPEPTGSRPDRSSRPLSGEPSLHARGLR